MKLLTQCTRCKKQLSTEEYIERFCETCAKPVERQVRKEAA